MKKIWFAILFCIVVATGARADLITFNDTWGSHELITGTKLNNWNSAFKNTINGLLDHVNIKAGGILNSNIANATIQSAKMECSSYWMHLTNCDGVIDINTDHKHYASDTVLLDTTGMFGGTTNVQTVLTDVAQFVGYSTATAATATYQMVYSGIGMDASTIYTAPTAATPTISIDVATGTATGGIVVNIGSNINVSCESNSGDVDVPLCVNGIPLSTSASDKPRYVFKVGCDAGSSVIGVRVGGSQQIIYRTTDGWNAAIENTISICSPYMTGALNGGKAKDFSMTLYLLR